MFLPLKDDMRPLRRPVVNYAIIGFTALVFVMQLSDETLIERFGMIPARVFDGNHTITTQELVHHPIFGPAVIPRAIAPSAIPGWLTLLSCIFLHGGWAHFLGNVWFLFVFGDNVEDRLGRVRYLLFYVGMGVAASLAHLLTNMSSTMPTIGASGAIAGVMGAYFVLFPRARVMTLMVIIILIDVIVLPAKLFLGFWFIFQLFQGLLLSGVTAVAWWAHIGGFAAGWGVVKLLESRGSIPPRPEIVRRRSPRPIRIILR